MNEKGVGNATGLVGRYFQDHIHCKAAPIVPTDRAAFASMYHAARRKGIKCLPRFEASATLQREKRITNACCDIVYVPSEDSPIESAKLVLRALREKDKRDRVPRALANVLRRPDQLAAAAYRYWITKEPTSDKTGTPLLGIAAEQEPNPESRVTLGKETDALGIPRTVLDWRLTSADRRTLEIFAETAAEEFRRLGIGTIDLSSFTLPDDPMRYGERINDGYHHMGTTRMNDDPKRGVVDRNCRVHDVDNLYIGSGAVFPTGSYSNCTLTIIALCLRLSDNLKRQLESHVSSS